MRLTAENLAHIPASLEPLIESGDMAGFVTLVWHKGEIVQHLALGWQNIAEKSPMQPDTLFRIASMTKPVTALAALLLWEDGKITLTDSIADWAPEFAHMRVLNHPQAALDDTISATRPITFDDLLTHRAGLAYSFTSEGPLASAYASILRDRGTVRVTPDQWLRDVAALPLLYQPGEKMHYSISLDLLGLLITRISGQPFRDFLRERIFLPLDMDDTDFYCPPEKHHRLASLYSYDETHQMLDAAPMRPIHTPPAFCGGGGGLISTARDYLKFARLLLNKGSLDGQSVAKAETIELMTTNKLTSVQRQQPFIGNVPLWDAMGYGYGLSMIMEPEKLGFLGRGHTGSFGWPGIFGTWWQADPVEDLVLIFLTQLNAPVSSTMLSDMTPHMLKSRLAQPHFQNTVYNALI